jgi:hypothetical protein
LKLLLLLLLPAIADVAAIAAAVAAVAAAAGSQKTRGRSEGLGQLWSGSVWAIPQAILQHR